jgi:large conductance mechanosensitive channel
MWREFKAFLVKENVLALAIAVVIGAALSKLVTALVNDFIMPIVAVVVPGGDWRAATLEAGPIVFLVGDFAGALIDFIIIAFVVWRISKAFIRMSAPKDKPATRECPYCVTTIDARATRCSSCTATLDKAA